MLNSLLSLKFTLARTLAILDSMDDVTVCFWDPFYYYYPRHIFLLQKPDYEVNGGDPGITIILASNAGIHNCLGLPSVANIGSAANGVPTLAQGRKKTFS